MSKNFQHVSFGESKNITIQVSIMDSWSSVKIDYGTMKQPLDSGKEKKKSTFHIQTQGWFSPFDRSFKKNEFCHMIATDFRAGPRSFQAKLGCCESKIKRERITWRKFF